MRDSTYWLINEDDKILGVVNIRHCLTEKLFNFGGHIGYGIRPSERRKGYATKILSLSLDKAKELGINLDSSSWGLIEEEKFMFSATNI